LLLGTLKSKIPDPGDAPGAGRSLNQSTSLISVANRLVTDRALLQLTGPAEARPEGAGPSVSPDEVDDVKYFRPDDGLRQTAVAESHQRGTVDDTRRRPQRQQPLYPVINEHNASLLHRPHQHVICIIDVINIEMKIKKTLKTLKQR